jgi:hypothetical protein
MLSANNYHYHHCLVGVTVDVLESLNTLLTPKDILGDAFDPPLNHFFYVLDEAQVAGKKYMGAFADADGKDSRPVLRPLILDLVRSELSSVIRTIVSGTGFSLDLFEKVVTSGVARIRYRVGTMCTPRGIFRTRVRN